MKDSDFVTVAIQKGFLQFDQVEEVQKLQKAMSEQGTETPIWEVCVLKGLLTREQVEQIIGKTQANKKLTFGPYTIVGKLGQGGMGAVYRARKEDGRVVALKVLPERASTDRNKERFKKESRIACSLQHPNLVRGIEAGMVGGRLYYAMEIVEGRTLANIVPERKGLDERKAVQVLVQIARAIDTVDKNGLVHRDIKPENIIIDRDGVAKLTDLGLIKSTMDDIANLTQDGHAIGTPHYMSPEQAQGKEVDVRSDLYSLGATLYYALTGIKPFHATSVLEVLKNRLDNKLEDISRVRKGLSPGVKSIVRKAMSLEMEKRYQTPAELIADLDGLLEGRAPAAKVAAAAPPPPAVEKKQLPLPWIMVGGGGLVAVVLLIVIIIIATSEEEPPAPPPVVQQPEEPPPPDPAIEAEAKIRGYLFTGKLNDAVRVLEERRVQLGSKAADLEALIEQEARGIWEQFTIPRDNEIARMRLNTLRRQVGDVPYLRGRIEDEFARMDEEDRRLAEEENAKKAEQYHKNRYDRLVEQVREMERAGELNQALETLQGALAAETNPLFRQRIVERISLVRARIARAKPEEPKVEEPEPEEDPKPVVKKEPEIEGELRKIEELIARDDYSVAILQLTDLIKRAPGEARLYGLRAFCFYKKENDKNAEADIRTGGRLDPTEPRLHLVAGLMNFDRGSYGVAADNFTRAISGNPGWHDAYYRRAQCYIHLKKWTDALRDLDEAAEIHKDYAAEPEFREFRLQGLVGAGKVDEALAILAVWIEKEPKNIEAWLRRGDLNMEAKQYSEAKKDYTKALRIDSKNARAKKGKSEASAALKKKPSRRSKKEGPQALLEDHFHAARERFKILGDGRIQVILSYDFRDDKQLGDFIHFMASQQPRALDLSGTYSRPGVVMFAPKIAGDFSVTVEYTNMQDVRNTGRGTILRTADSDNPQLTGTGIGLSLVRMGQQGSPAWNVCINQAAVDVISPYKLVNWGQGLKSLSLSRRGTKYTGYYGSGTRVEGTRAGFASTRLRFLTYDQVRISKFELSTTLDPEWVQNTLKIEGGPKVKESDRSKPLWNGRDLSQFKRGSSGFRVDGGSILGDFKDAGRLIHNDRFQSGMSHLVFEIEVEEVHQGPEIAVGFMMYGTALETWGNVLCTWTSIGDLRIDRFDQQWKERTSAAGKKIEKGTYKVEVIAAGRALTLKIEGVGEVRYPYGIPSGGLQYSPVVVVSGAKVRIKSMVERQ